MYRPIVILLILHKHTDMLYNNFESNDDKEISSFFFRFSYNSTLQLSQFDQYNTAENINWPG